MLGGGVLKKQQHDVASYLTQFQVRVLFTFLETFIDIERQQTIKSVHEIVSLSRLIRQWTATWARLWWLHEPRPIKTVSKLRE